MDSRYQLTRYNPAVTILSMDFLAGLNPQQKKAVQSDPGPVLVLAGPGSGKTRVLTHKIAYLIGFAGVKPYHILAVTFTNKAAKEMKNRVELLLGKSSRGLMLGTFHATCAKILRREAEHLPFNANYVIFDADDQRKITKQAILDIGLDIKQYKPGSIHAVISQAKNNLTFPEDFSVNTYRDEVIRRVYVRYQNYLLASNALDFDDLLLWTAFLLEENPAVRDRYARRFEHILVDEFQDTNFAQYTLLTNLSVFHRNIFVVGDADQSIYRWRGADYQNVLRFEEYFSDAQVIMLEQNYRSTQIILDTAMSVIDRNPTRKPKKLFTVRGKGQKVILREMYDDREEAVYVINTIAGMVAQGKAQPGDFAVMYRVNAQSRILEEAFLTAGLPYRLVGAQRFYGRREIKDLIAYLRLIRNPKDDLSLYRVINTPPRGIGTKTLASLKTIALKTNMSMGDLLLALAIGEESPYWNMFSKRAATNLSRFGRMFSLWITHRDELSPLEIMDSVLDDTGYRDYIDDGTDEGKDRWDNIIELRRLAGEYREQGLDAFLETVALVSDQDTIEDDVNAPTLLTLHTAKGLEFSNVFIIGLNDGILPHSRSLEDQEELEEERRLLYVGITRAKNLLVLLYSLNRNVFGYIEPVEPSRFLADIPITLLDEGSPGFVIQQSAFKRREDKWDVKPLSSVGLLEKKYKPGMHVVHAQWGEGVVLNTRIQDEDEIVDIFFESVGLKKVSAAVAKLDIRK